MRRDKEKDQENVVKHVLESNMMMEYALDEPSKPANLEVTFETSKSTHSVSLMQIGTNSLRTSLAQIVPFAVVEVSIGKKKKKTKKNCFFFFFWMTVWTTGVREGEKKRNYLLVDFFFNFIFLLQLTVWTTD